jgi:hypothetical protein
MMYYTIKPVQRHHTMSHTSTTPGAVTARTHQQQQLIAAVTIWKHFNVVHMSVS